MTTTSKRPRRGLFWILTINGDYPESAMPLDLRYRWDNYVLKYLQERYTVCQFKNKTSYSKGRRLVGLHKKYRRERTVDKNGEPVVVQIGKFQGLVEPLGYERLPLPEAAKKTIRWEHQRLNYSVQKLATDWDVSESHILKILKKEKPPVSSSGDRIKQGFFDAQPPRSNALVPDRGGYDS